MATTVGRLSLRQLPAVSRRWARLFSDDKGRILSEEERAVENVYIQKMERERMEKLKKKKEKAAAEQVENEKTANKVMNLCLFGYFEKKKNISLVTSLSEK